MKIIIPMSGEGQRFKDAGYVTLKPLIEVDGKPIIAHVINLFSNDSEFIFICNKEHLKNTDVKDILFKYCPSGKIIPIEPHKKGPVYAVIQALEYISDNEEVIVNYCDFSCYWSFSEFCKYVRSNKLDGCIPAYKGFHPHSLGSTNYAYILEDKQEFIDIKEKEPFTDKKMNEYASSGTYYFSKGKYIKQYFMEAIELGMQVKNEYYCSLIYKLMFRDGLRIKIFELKYFMQWGTPLDLEIYKRWSKLFQNLVLRKRSNEVIFGTTIIAMAGKGSRFLSEGFTTQKPFISISNYPMYIQAAKSLPKSADYKFIYKDIYNPKNHNHILKNYFKKFEFIKLKSTPPGQAISVLEGIKKVQNELINISACDHSIIFNYNLLKETIIRKSFDILVWVKKGYKEATLQPNMYSWVDCQGQKIKRISVKKPLKNPSSDPLVIGTFSFLNKDIYIKTFNKLLQREVKVNNEFYIDSMINIAIGLGYKCKIFEVDEFICWGTPNEYRTFEYWRNCFNILEDHLYNSNDDNFF